MFSAYCKDQTFSKFSRYRVPFAIFQKGLDKSAIGSRGKEFFIKMGDIGEQLEEELLQPSIFQLTDKDNKTHSSRFLKENGKKARKWLRDFFVGEGTTLKSTVSLSTLNHLNAIDFREKVSQHIPGIYEILFKSTSSNYSLRKYILKIEKGSGVALLRGNNSRVSPHIIKITTLNKRHSQISGKNTFIPPRVMPFACGAIKATPKAKPNKAMAGRMRR